MTHIFYFTTVDEQPLDGTRQQFRHVDILRRNGFEALVVNEHPDKVPDWLPTTCPVLSFDEYLKLYETRDIVVLPEVGSGRKYGDERKVMFNQNAYQSFFFCGLQREKPLLFNDPRLEAVMVNSENNRDLIQHIFPDLRVELVPNAANPDIFKPGPKRKRISFFMRKNLPEVELVINALILSGIAAEWEPFGFDRWSDAEVASILAESALYLHFGYPEGLNLAVMEAMLCGCYVIGYHGFGNLEYMKEEFCAPIQCADSFRLLLETEKAIKEYSSDPRNIIAKAMAGRQYILEHYSVQQEEAAVVTFWKEIIESRQR